MKCFGLMEKKYTVAGAVSHKKSIFALLSVLDKQDLAIKSNRTVCGLQ